MGGDALRLRALTHSTGPAGRRRSNSAFSLPVALQNEIANEVSLLFERIEKFGSIDVVVSQKHFVGRDEKRPLDCLILIAKQSFSVDWRRRRLRAP
jgi:Uri superfamily endonuclease